MRRKTLSVILRVCLSAILLCFSVTGNGAPCAAKAEEWYSENDWNFVDESMPVGKGIPEEAQGVLGQIRKNGVLRVATDASNPPRSFVDPDRNETEQYAGADMELARYIAARMGVKLKIVPMEPERVLPSLLYNQCDLAISSIAFTPSRALSYTLSRTYAESETVPTVGVLVLRGSPIQALSDLEGKVIIALSNSVAETVAVREVRNYLEFRRITVSQNVGMTMEQGLADAAFVDVAGSRYFLEQNPDSDLMLVEGLEFTPDDIYLGSRVAAKKGELQLMYFVNGVIGEVLDQDLYTAWLRDAETRASELGLTQ